MKTFLPNILCALIFVFSLISCSKTDPTSPDNGNNTSTLSGKVIYNYGIDDRDTNRIIYAYDLQSGSNSPIVKGNVYCFSKPEKNKVPYIRSYFNNAMNKHLSQIEIYDFLANKSEIVGSTERNPMKNIFRGYRYVALTPDAKSIVYVFDSTNTNTTLYQNRKLVVRNLESNRTIVLAKEVATEQYFKISPDSKYVVYFGGEGSSGLSKDEIYISSLDGTFEKKLDIDTKYMYDFGTWFEWSPDSKYLICVNQQRDKIIVVNTNTWLKEKEIDCTSTGGVVGFPIFIDNSSIALISIKKENQKVTTSLFSYSLTDNVFTPFNVNTENEFLLKLNPTAKNGTIVFSTVPTNATDFDVFRNNQLYTYNFKDTSLKKIGEKSSFDFFLID